MRFARSTNLLLAGVGIFGGMAVTGASGSNPSYNEAFYLIGTGVTFILAGVCCYLIYVSSVKEKKLDQRRRGIAIDMENCHVINIGRVQGEGLDTLIAARDSSKITANELHGVDCNSVARLRSTSEVRVDAASLRNQGSYSEPKPNRSLRDRFVRGWRPGQDD